MSAKSRLDLDAIRARLQDTAAGPWEMRESAGAGISIHGTVDLGRQSQMLDEAIPSGPLIRRLYEVSLKPSLQVADDGRAWAKLSHEVWMQFPSVDFDKMQRANGAFIAAARSDVPALVGEVERLLAEVARLRSWIADLQGGLDVNCVYCGHRFGPAESTPTSQADALKAHVETCPDHPMSALKAELERRKPVANVKVVEGRLQYEGALFDGPVPDGDYVLVEDPTP